MKLSTRSRYGTRAMIDIACQGPGKPSQLKDISKRQKISAKYLDHLLSKLRKAGLIQNIRGRNGGYILTRPAHEITLKEIVLVLEGSLAPVECVENLKYCNQMQTCYSRNVWKKLKTEIEGVLESITIQELIDSQSSKSSPLNYCI